MPWDNIIDCQDVKEMSSNVPILISGGTVDKILIKLPEGQEDMKIYTNFSPEIGSLEGCKISDLGNSDPYIQKMTYDMFFHQFQPIMASLCLS